MAESYSYKEDLKRYKEEQAKRRKMLRRHEGNFEPRRYTSRDASFAGRLDAGARMLGDES